MISVIEGLHHEHDISDIVTVMSMMMRGGSGPSLQLGGFSPPAYFPGWTSILALSPVTMIDWHHNYSEDPGFGHQHLDDPS